MRCKSDAEQKLWNLLRNRQLADVKFRRQCSMDLYILDFYAPEIKLAIELDGSIHKIRENKKWDEERTEYLKSKNIKVVRFWNFKIENDLENVLNKIGRKIKELLNI